MTAPGAVDAPGTVADRIAITDVLLCYAHAVDRQDLDLARSCYHPDAVDDHGRYSGGVDGLIEFFAALGSTLRRTFHQMGPPWIRFTGPGTALAETYCLYRRETHDSAPEDAVLQGLRYLDRLERRDGRWAIAERTVVLDWEQSGARAPAVPAGPTWKRGALGDADPSAPFLRSG
ncbi:nuclear transport factor 2 family protein [Pseudonocardia sp. C8]|uniref:nuclear transport factor 2 family protein n=1 Tax=Pseudonocardia sp. C8 TaxID=2762759 RepID=UPI001642CD3C|nr:nuclear transport factor 2 family protein [Pseudonocardia sp. C8]